MTQPKPQRTQQEVFDETIGQLAESYDDPRSTLNHLRAGPLPSRETILALLADVRAVLMPDHYFGRRIREGQPSLMIGGLLEKIHLTLREQIHLARTYERPATQTHLETRQQAEREALQFIEHLPRVRQMLALDAQAAYEGDPAAKSFDEIIFCYPGFSAIATYRIAHVLHQFGVPLLPRIMTEAAHSQTGVDIHPGARIGRSFFIDHATGVVIGETTVIGQRVKIYQGVTLGALSFPKDAQGQIVRGTKRHPTIEDDVVIYAGATILGGETVIGRGAVIGGSCWITQSVPTGTKVLLQNPQMKFKGTHPIESTPPPES